MQIIEHALFKAAAPMTRLERIQAALQEEEKKRRKLPTTHGDTPSVPAKRRRNGEELCASLHGVNTSDTPKYARVFLGKEQLEVLNAVEAGKSVFYTGAAGEYSPGQHIGYAEHLPPFRDGEISTAGVHN